LSPKACQGILRRAEKRGKELPSALLKALMAATGNVGHTLLSTDEMVAPDTPTKNSSAREEHPLSPLTTNPTLPTHASPARTTSETPSAHGMELGATPRL